jgi:hypothetical protein
MQTRLALAAACLAITATAAQAQNAACTNGLKQITEIKLEPLSDGRWLVPIKVNGADKKFLLDISTVPSAIFSEYATEAGLSLQDALPITPPPGTAASGGGGRSGRGGGDASAGRGTPSAPSKVAKIDSFGLGTLQSNNGFFKVASDDKKIRALDAAIVGILGTDMLSKQDFDLDFGAKTIKLFASDHCPGKVVYWSGPTVAVEFYVDGKDHIRFPVLVDGKELSASISTTAAQNEMSLVFGKRKLDIDVEKPGFEKVADTDPARYSRRFQSVDMGGLAIQNPLIVVVDDSKTNKIDVQGGGAIRTVNMDRTIPDVTLGTNFINKFHLYFASKEFKIYITPAVTIPAP